MNHLLQLAASKESTRWFGGAFWLLASLVVLVVAATLGGQSAALSPATLWVPGLFLLVAAGCVTLVLSCLRQLAKRARHLEAQEQALAMAKERFSDRIDQQRQEIERARREATAGRRAKREFLSCVHHELKTPMVGALGYCDLLLQTSLTLDQRHLVKRARSSGYDLLAQVEKILKFAQIEAERLDVEKREFDLRMLVSRLINELTPAADEKGLRLTMTWSRNVPRRIRQDRDLLESTLSHLLENAIKFTKSGHIALVVGTVRDQQRLRFTLRDTGVGIPADALAKVFDPLTQADSSDSRLFTGLGLGLTISQRLCEKLGGQLEAASTPGSGTCFQIEIPFSAAQDPLPMPAPEIRLIPPTRVDDGDLPLVAASEHLPPPLPFRPQESGTHPSISF